MKICIFSHTFPRFSGDTAAPFMANLAASLAEAGHDVTVLLPFDEKLKLKTREKYRIKSYKYIFPDSLHVLGYSRTLAGDKTLKVQTYFLSPLMFLFGFLALLNLVRREKIDIVSSHWIITNGFMAALVYKISGVPFTTAIPGSDIYLGGKNKLFAWMVGLAAHNASAVLSDSSHYLKQLADLGFKPKKKAIIRYGVNINEFKPGGKDKKVLARLRLTEKTPIILAVGRLVPKKGFLYLVRAMPRVLKEEPRARLVIVGDGAQKAELRDEVEKLSITEEVIFAGTVSYGELSKYYNLGDVFVMPSIKDENGNIDASPVAMMEAMACGTPVVATRFSGSTDFIQGGQTGCLVGEKDSKGIAKAIITLLRRQKKPTSARVRKIAIDNFSSRATAQRYINVFQEILQR